MGGRGRRAPVLALVLVLALALALLLCVCVLVEASGNEIGIDELSARLKLKSSVVTPESYKSTYGQTSGSLTGGTTSTTSVWLSLLLGLGNAVSLDSLDWLIPPIHEPRVSDNRVKEEEGEAGCTAIGQAGIGFGARAASRT